MSKHNGHPGSSNDKFNANLSDASSASVSKAQQGALPEDRDVHVIRSSGNGLNATPGIGGIVGPVMYARTLRPESIEAFLSGEFKLTNSMEELMLSNDDDVVIVLKRGTTVDPDKWSTQGIGPNSLKELQLRGFDIDHVYQNTPNGQKMVWNLKANPDGTYSVVDHGKLKTGGASFDLDQKNMLEIRNFYLEGLVRKRCTKLVI